MTTPPMWLSSLTSPALSATAEAFAAQFSGTLVTPHSEPAAWGVRIGEIANAVALRAMRHARLWGVRIGEIANAVALRAMRHARLSVAPCASRADRVRRDRQPTPENV